MCINADKYPRRNSTSSRPPRPMKNIEEPPMMIDAYEAQRVEHLVESSQRTRRRVSFDEVVMVRPVLPLVEFTDKEIIACWYLPVEKQRMRVEIMSIVKVIKEKNRNSKKQFNVRGLEWLAQKDKCREKARKASINGILLEQESQRVNSEEAVIYDALRFRKAYKRHSRAALHTAVAMGKIDAMEAGTMETSQMHKTSSMMSLGKKGNSSLTQMGNESWNSNSTRSTRSTSTRSERSVSTKGNGSRKTRRGARRFSLA